MSEPYIPANGTEGAVFQAAWCDLCAREREYRETGDNPCMILTEALVLGDQPQEWLLLDGRPSCAAFLPDVVSAKQGE